MRVAERYRGEIFHVAAQSLLLNSQVTNNLRYKLWDYIRIITD